VNWGEEVGLSPEEVGLRMVGTQQNEDGLSTGYIFAGQIGVSMALSPRRDCQEPWFTDRTVPEGQNHDHILNAVAAARNNLLPTVDDFNKA